MEVRENSPFLQTDDAAPGDARSPADVDWSALADELGLRGPVPRTQLKLTHTVGLEPDRAEGRGQGADDLVMAAVDEGYIDVATRVDGVSLAFTWGGLDG